MKSIKQIFRNDQKLISNSAVIELIDYCHELEDEIINNKQSSKFNNEDILTELTRDIYSSIVDTLNDDEEAKRFVELNQIDYEDALINLKKYLETFSKENNFRL